MLAKLGVEHYRRIGKLGAQVRWDRASEPSNVPSISRSVLSSSLRQGNASI